MAVHHGVDGKVLAVKYTFLDEEDDQPLIPAAGYPKVLLFDDNGDRLVSVLGAATSEFGTWAASVPVPMMNLEERKEFFIRWLFKDQDGNKVKVQEAALIEPGIDKRADDVVTLYGDETFTFVLPLSFQDGWSGSYQIFYGNDKCLEQEADLTANEVEKNIGIDSTAFTVSAAPVPYPLITSYLLNVRVTPPTGKQRMYNYKLWALTPQIVLAKSHLEDFLNRSRIENTIPELRYNDGDLIGYLERGLYMFNRVGYPTAFNGTNMLGALFDAWLICSCYYALGAQLLAEGSLAFDFSGQGLSLNVDRTPQLEAALGRIESQIDSQVVPLKKILNTQGITTGDGSAGATNLNNPPSSGRLGIINAATTHIPSYATFFAGRRRW